MTYTATGAVARTLDLVATLAKAQPATQSMLRVASEAAALQRLLPGDATLLESADASAWDGTQLPVEPPLILLEAMEPEYEQISLRTWHVTHSVVLHMLHRRETGDLARDAYLRAWDEHSAIAEAWRAAASAVQITLIGVRTTLAPSIFSTAAPAAFQRQFYSTLTLSYQKGQP